MYNISGQTLSHTISRAFEAVQGNGIIQGSRNGKAAAIFDTTFEFLNPRSRHLHLEGRKSNIFQLIAETFWVMAGCNAVDGYLEFFLPRARQYSDDGNTWHGAYGPRIYAFDQLKNAVNLFATDGFETRRSFVTISMPHLDNPHAITELYGEGHKPKDIPCNREIQFYTEGNQFHAKVIQRSGDLLFGTGSINPFEFSFLQELVYNELKKMPGSEQLELGSYRWHVTNAHIYDQFADQAVEVTSRAQSFPENNIPLVGPVAGVVAWEHFFGSLVAIFGSMISYEPEYLKQQANKFWEDLEDLLHQYGVPQQNNLMWIYVELIYNYILSKRDVSRNYKMDIPDNLEGDLQLAVLSSPFRKFVISDRAGFNDVR